MSMRPIHNENDYDKALDRVDMHLKQQDLVPYIGNKSKVSEVLNRKVRIKL